MKGCFRSKVKIDHAGFENILYHILKIHCIFFLVNHSGEDSVGSSQTSVPSSDAELFAAKSLHRATELLKTPKKTTPEQRISPRKPLKPVKSVNQSDPRFKGVTLRLKTALGKRKSSRKSPAQLLIDCCFSARKKRQSEDTEGKIPRRRTSPSLLNPSIFSLSHADDDTELDDYSMDLELGVAPLRVEKECASCGTYRTPLWRDAEDGTPLCNACGIRYKKYRIRCVRCWYIPKKEEKALPCCTSCGHHFKVTLARRGNSFTSE